MRIVQCFIDVVLRCAYFTMYFPKLGLSGAFCVCVCLLQVDGANWIPSDQYSNSSSVNWFARQLDQRADESGKSSFARNFHDEDVTTADADRVFANEYLNYHKEFNERDSYKAVPFQLPEQISPNLNGNYNNNNNHNNAAHFHATIFPQPTPSNLGTGKPYSQSSSAAAAIQISTYPNLQSQPQQPYNSYQTHSQNLENFDYLPPAPYQSYPYPSHFTDNTNTTKNLELNTRHLLYLQPGKCSNSIEVGRLRDLEIKSTFKYGNGNGNGNDNQKAVCVLMLYSANENNKLAISMQSTRETSSAEAITENYLENSIKVYSLQNGAIVYTPIRFLGTKYLSFYLMCIVSVDRFLQSSSQLEPVVTTQTSILWSLAPCQSAFWVPNIPTAFNQNWITYQYEGNPLSKFGECVFTLESDPNTRIEMVITEVHLFGKELTFPPPCLELHDVKADGSVTLLKKECGIILAGNEFEMFPTFTDTNVAVISTTIRYGSFQLRARAVPRNFGFPKASSTPTNRPAVDASPTVVPSGVVSPATNQPVVDSLPSVITILPLPANSTFKGAATESNSFFARPIAKRITEA